MTAPTNSAPVDVLAVLRSRFEGCNVDEGFAGGSFLHPADAKMVHDVVAELIDAAAYALRTRDEAGALSDTAEHNLREALIGAGGAK